MSKDRKRGASRYMMDPDELVLVETPGEPFYDKRVHFPVRPGMVKSILRYGVIEDVIIVSRGETYVVAAGRQRVRAAREAKLVNPEVLVPCSIRGGSDLDLETIAQIENEQRQNDDPISRVEKMQRLLSLSGYEHVAEVYDIGVAQVKSLLKALDLPNEVKELVASGKIPITAAVKLHGIPEKEQVSSAEKLATAGTSKVENARRIRGNKTIERSVPSKTYVRKMIGVMETGEVGADEESLYILKWLMGQCSPDTAKKHVSWLAAAIVETDKDNRKKADVKAKSKKTPKVASRRKPRKAKKTE